ncbi:hypothetical protein G6L37_02610 [Agrobacterium rubi]|nr:hypothetical protein [Agrobacterium rubi]NTF24288.1 hypothetical protein [Agrobacterium rubi]
MDFPDTGSRGHLPLMEALTKRLSDDDVETIARADYGIDAERHAAAITAIRRTVEIPSPLDWVPREVLNLTRWSDPQGSQDTVSGHIRRAFASMVILYADSVDGLGWGGSNTDMAVLTDSVHALGGDLVEAGADFASWLIARETDRDELPFLGLAFFSLALPSPGRWNDTILMEVAEWVMRMDDETAASTKADHSTVSNRPWLLGGPASGILDRTWSRIGGNLESLSRKAHRKSQVTEVASLFGAVLEP